MARTITPKIDARLFTAQMNAKEKARCNIRQYIPIGAIKGNFWDDAPAPGMYYETDINMWCSESFKLEKMEIIEEDTQRIIDTTPDEERDGYSVNGKKLVPIEVSKPIVEPLPEAVEQSKKTRRSARMDEADFDILAGKFIYPTDLAEKKPLFFPTDIRESLKLVARLIPGGKVSPSHIAIHIIRAWLDENRDLLNRMLSSQKLSI